MLLSSPAYVISPTFSVFPWPETITVSRWRRQEIECRNEFAPSRFTRQASVFCGSAVATTGEQRSGLYVSSAGAWCTHPGAVKYITCRVMSFRPWQSSVGPLRGLSCLRGGIALILSIPTMTRPASPFISSIFRSPRSASVFGDFLFRSFHPPPRIRLPPLALLIFQPSVLTSFASRCTAAVICDQHATKRRSSVRCHDPETPH